MKSHSYRKLLLSKLLRHDLCILKTKPNFSFRNFLRNSSQFISIFGCFSSFLVFFHLTEHDMYLEAIVDAIRKFSPQSEKSKLLNPGPSPHYAGGI